MIKNKFGKTFGIKESSVYKSVLKERNLNKKKSGGGIKLKEIAHEAINHFGNPVSFSLFYQNNAVSVAFENLVLEIIAPW